VTRYRIQPAGVQKVLNTTKADAEKFEPILKPLEGWVTSCATATGNSGAVVPALQSFFTDQSTLLEAITRRVGAGLTGAYQATDAYMKGDLEMVGTYQQSAVTASLAPPPAPGPGRRAY
jgi:hypothetical protein